MKPAWDKLADSFEGNKDVVIADVDCTKDESKDLCSKYGVRGYPTIKYFTSSTDPMGDKYSGGRTYEDMKKFADENLGPSCGPDNLDLCSDEQKAEIEKFMDMDVAELKKAVDEKTKEMDDAEQFFKDEVQKLQKRYEELSKEKDDKVAAVGPDLRVMRVVLGAKDGSANAKDEL
jgi:protein disulfide-isomerase A6